MTEEGWLTLAEIVMDGLFWMVVVYAVCRMMAGGWLPKIINKVTQSEK